RAQRLLAGPRPGAADGAERLRQERRDARRRQLRLEGPRVGDVHRAARGTTASRARHPGARRLRRAAPAGERRPGHVHAERMKPHSRAVLGLLVAAVLAAAGAAGAWKATSGSRSSPSAQAASAPGRSARMAGAIVLTVSPRTV